MREPDAVDLSEAGKIGRVIRKYELTGVPAELATRWAGNGGDRYSLRSLADYFNERVLAAAVADAGVDSMPGGAENLYLVLTGEEGSAGERTELRRRLERDGVDVDALKRDFVSHQTIHTFLTDHLEERYEVDDDEQLRKDADRVSRLESRLAAVAGDAVERSDRVGRITVGDTEVFVETRVLCTECGETTTVQDLFENGGCACQSSDE